MAHMLKIRLQRVGRKNNPSFRIVLTDSQNATRSGKYAEMLGSYDARGGANGVKPVFNTERITYWMSKGAKPTDTVHNLLLNAKIISGKKINVLPRKSPPKPEVDPKAAAAASAAPAAAPAAAAPAPEAAAAPEVAAPAAA